MSPVLDLKISWLPPIAEEKIHYSLLSQYRILLLNRNLSPVRQKQLIYIHFLYVFFSSKKAVFLI